MSADHTPGPWSEPLTYGINRFEIHGDIYGKTKRVAIVDELADARLIAAAPQLLGALLAIQSAVLNQNYFAVGNAFGSYASAAIAKAVGGAT